MADKRPNWDGPVVTMATKYGLLKPVNALSFAMTGEMSVTRQTMEQTIAMANGTVHDAIKATTAYLIVPNDPDFRKGSKYKAAVDQGKSIITEEQFCDMIMPTVDDLLGASSVGGTA